jgi:hypothetical protein
MSNRHLLIKNIADLVAEERKLWLAFRAAERDSNIGVLDVRKQVRISQTLFSTKVTLAASYPYIQIMAVLSAFGASFGTGPTRALSWGVYMAATFLAIYSRDKFIQEYSRLQTGQEEINNQAFGIDFISLRVYKFFNEKSKEKGKALDEKKLEKIIKLVKSAQEYEASTLGYSDYIHKAFVAAIFTAPISLPIFIDTYHQKISLYWGDSMDFLKIHPYIGASILLILLLVAFAGSLFLYVIAYGDKAATKKKKQYLLFLNLLKEAYAKSA